MRCEIAVTGRRGWQDFMPAMVLLIVSAAGIFVAALSPSGDYGQYMVVGPPWFSLAQTVGLVDLAGGDIVDVGTLPSVVIVHSINPRFVRALYRAGAWLVIDPVRPRGCWGFERNRASKLGGV
jgi:hypothetical protein